MGHVLHNLGNITNGINGHLIGLVVAFALLFEVVVLFDEIAEQLLPHVRASREIAVGLKGFV